ncbi:glycosyltransferase family 4 protein [Shewanella chilikensis]|uniref:glycosyltransferase family 4 protein n=1 Tax=Shewanella chilikensis TaxID=558541 RepID=UPI003A980A99
MRNESFLGVFHFGPPGHGASMVGDQVVKLVEKHFQSFCFYNLSLSSKVDDIGHLSVFKFIKIFKLYWVVVFKLFVFRPKVVYFTPALNGFAIYRDFIFLFIFYFYRFLFGAKVICHIHMLPTKLMASDILKKIWTFITSDFTIICLTNSLRESFFVLKNKNVGVLSNCLIFDKSSFVGKSIRKTKCSSTYSSYPYRLIFIGHLMESKGFNRFLSLVPKYPDCQFVILGKTIGANSQRLLNEVIEKYGDRVEYHGFISGVEKLRVLSSCDLYILPSFSEAQPLTIIESLYCGVPILATNVGGIPDMVNQTVGASCSFEKFDEYLPRLLYAGKTSYSESCVKMFNDNYTLEKFEANFVKVFC